MAGDDDGEPMRFSVELPPDAVRIGEGWFWSPEVNVKPSVDAEPPDLSGWVEMGCVIEDGPRPLAVDGHAYRRRTRGRR